MRTFLLAVLCVLPPVALAQDDGDARETRDAASNAQPTDLEAVRVVGRRPPADPFAFRNPVEVEGTVFSRAWDEPPSLEEVGMRGGYVQIGINKGLELAAKGIRKLPGWKLQIRDAEARPPPLDEAQAARAARLHAAEAEAPSPL